MKYDSLRKLERNKQIREAVKAHPELSLAEIGGWKQFNISASRVSRISGGIRKRKGGRK